jgi:hypothetical protein
MRSQLDTHRHKPLSYHDTKLMHKNFQILPNLNRNVTIRLSGWKVHLQNEIYSNMDNVGMSAIRSC